MLQVTAQSSSGFQRILWWLEGGGWRFISSGWSLGPYSTHASGEPTMQPLLHHMDHTIPAPLFQVPCVILCEDLENKGRIDITVQKYNDLKLKRRYSVNKNPLHQGTFSHCFVFVPHYSAFLLVITSFSLWYSHHPGLLGIPQRFQLSPLLVKGSSGSIFAYIQMGQCAQQIKKRLPRNRSHSKDSVPIECSPLRTMVHRVFGCQSPLLSQSALWPRTLLFLPGWFLHLCAQALSTVSNTPEWSLPKWQFQFHQLPV